MAAGRNGIFIRSVESRIKNSVQKGRAALHKRERSANTTLSRFANRFVRSLTKEIRQAGLDEVTVTERLSNSRRPMYPLLENVL